MGYERYFEAAASTYKLKDIRPEDVDELKLLVWEASTKEDCDVSDPNVSCRGPDEPGEEVMEKMVKNRMKPLVIKLMHKFKKAFETGDISVLRDETDATVEDYMSAASAGLNAFRKENPDSPKLQLSNNAPEVMTVVDAFLRATTLAPN